MRDINSTEAGKQGAPFHPAMQPWAGIFRVEQVRIPAHLPISRNKITQGKAQKATTKLKIEFPLTERLARQTRQDLGTAVRHALEERLCRIAAPLREAVLLEKSAAIRQRWNTMPVFTQRSADDMNYDDEHHLLR